MSEDGERSVGTRTRALRVKFDADLFGMSSALCLVVAGCGGMTGDFRPGGGTGGKSAEAAATGGQRATGGRPASDDDDDAATGAGGTGGQPVAAAGPPCERFTGLDDNCRVEISAARPSQVNILLVLEKSGSLTDQTAYGRPKWEALTSALDEALNHVRVRDDQTLSLGLMLYPGTDTERPCDTEECCQLPSEAVNVDVGAASDTVASILDTLASVRPAGLNPMRAALDEALRYFTIGNGSMLAGQHYVLLVSDGGPTCNAALACGDDECTLALDGLCERKDCCENEGTGLWCVDGQRTQDTIAELVSANVRTLFVGLPGSERYAEWYADFATAGDTSVIGPTDAGYWAVSADGGEDELVATFESIIQSVTEPCRIQFDEGLPETLMGLVNVAIDCQLVPRGGSLSDGAAGADGEREPTNWFVDESTDPPTVEITGSYCDRVKQGGVRADIVIGCLPRL